MTTDQTTASLKLHIEANEVSVLMPAFLFAMLKQFGINHSYNFELNDLDKNLKMRTIHPENSKSPPILKLLTIYIIYLTV